MNPHQKDTYDQAITLYNEDKYPDAIALCQQILEEAGKPEFEDQENGSKDEPEAQTTKAPENGSKDVPKTQMTPESDNLTEEDLGNIYYLMGRCYNLSKDYENARDSFVKALKIRSKCLGEPDNLTLWTADWLGCNHTNMGDWQSGKEVFTALLKRRKKVLGEQHRDVFRTTKLLSMCMGSSEEQEAKKKLLTEAIELADALFGANDDETVDVKFRLATLYYDQSEYPPAIALLEKMLQDYTDEYEDDETTIKILRKLADNYYYMDGKEVKAAQCYKQAIDIYDKTEKEVDHAYVMMHYEVGNLNLHYLKNYPDAIQAYLVVLKHGDAFLKENSWVKINTCSDMGQIGFESLGDHETAETYLNKALSLIEKSGKNHDKKVIKINYYLIQIRLAAKRKKEAEQLLKETIELSKQVYGLQHQTTRAIATLYFKNFPTSKHALKLAMAFKSNAPEGYNHNAFVREALQSEDNNKKIRVFISSTFRDMMAEREYLLKNIFPKLRKLCREKGYDFTEVDLRWGITKEESENGKVIEICLNEIDQSRPYFIGMIGERYGWIPDYEDTDDFKNMLRNFAWLHQDVQEGLSVTEMEIQYGVLRNPDMKGNAFFYLRDKSATPDGAGFVEPDGSREQKKLLELKQRLADQDLFPVKDYQTIEELGEAIFNDLKLAIFREDQESAEQSALQASKEKQINHIKSLCDFYLPDASMNKALDKFLHTKKFGFSKKSNKLILYGNKGEGRSALLANYIQSYYLNNTGKVKPIFFHFVEAEPDKKSIGDILKNLMQEINTYNNTGVFFDDSNLQSPAPVIEQIFSKTSKEMVLVIDGLEQIKTPEFFSRLYWLPQNVPSNIKIILSTNDPELYNNISGYEHLPLPPFDKDQRKLFIKEYLGKYGKKLSAKQLQKVVDATITQKPNNLKLVLDELRIFGVFEKLDAFLSGYLEAKDEVAVFTKVLERLEEDFEAHDPGLIGRIFSLMVCSKHGLLESELIDLAETAPMYWSPVYHSIENQLYRNLGQLSVINPDFATAIKNRYLKDSAKINEIRQKIVDYFQALDDLKRTYEELSFQLLQREDFEQLKDHLARMDVFLLYKDDPQEFMDYWDKLKGHFDFAGTYKQSFLEYEQQEDVIPADLLPAFDRLSALLGIGARKKESTFFAEKSLELAEKIYGPQHLSTANAIAKYAGSLVATGDYDKAETYALKAFDIYDQASDTGSKFAVLLSTLGNIYIFRKQFEEAEPYIDRAQELLVSIWGKENFALAIGPYFQKAQILLGKEQYDEALELCQKSLSLIHRYGGQNHMINFTAQDTIVEIYMHQEKLDEALVEVEKSIRQKKQAFGANHRMVLLSEYYKALIVYRKGEVQKALKLAKEVYKKYESDRGSDHPLTLKVMELIEACEENDER
jgi:hypothetical protein